MDYRKTSASYFLRLCDIYIDPDRDCLFDATAYYKEYLRLDCIVLAAGLKSFDKLISDIDPKLSIFDSLTISSLTDKYMITNGAYEGVYEMRGNLRAYVGRAVTGGRCHVNTKYLKQIIEGQIADYDAVSCYPSAIKRLCDELGLPTGPARRLTDTSQWESKEYCVLTVHKAVNKHQAMPFITHRTEDSMNYSNDAPEKPVVIDSHTLRDYIKFHEIEYDVLDGVFWDGPTNRTMGDLVQKLFDA